MTIKYPSTGDIAIRIIDSKLGTVKMFSCGKYHVIPCCANVQLEVTLISNLNLASLNFLDCGISACDRLLMSLPESLRIARLAL